MSTTMTDEVRRTPVDGIEVAQQLERLARVVALLDVPDAHVGASVSLMNNTTDQLDINIHCRDIDEVRAVRRAVGHCEKQERSTGGFYLHGQVEGVKVTIWPPAGVCKQVQVGTETVKREEIVEPAKTRTVTEEVPVYEWDCGPVLIDEGEQVPA